MRISQVVSRWTCVWLILVCASPVSAGGAVLDYAGDDHWYGVYMAGRKIGHAHCWMSSIRASRERVEVGVEMSIAVSGSGASDVMRVSDRRTFGSRDPYALMGATYHSEASGVTDHRTLQGGTGGWWVTRKLDGQPMGRQKVPSPKETLLAQVPLLAQHGGGLRAGRVHKAWSFQWEALKDLPVVAEVMRVNTRTIAGVATTKADLQLTTTLPSGRPFVVQTTLAGSVVLSMQLGPALELRLEEKSVAKGDVAGIDADAAGVALEARIGSPYGVTRLVLEARLPRGVKLPPRGNRKVARRENGVLEVTIESRPGASVGASERREALEADLTFNHQHPALRAKSTQVTAGLRTPTARVKALIQFVHRHLAKRLATNLPTASVVLAKGYGDCTEHTWLFVALCRAAGIPARPVYGLAYVDGPVGRFAYHAWAEVALDGAWVEVDPTWGEERADATHVQLGDDLTALASWIGGMTLRLVSVQRD